MVFWRQGCGHFEDRVIGRVILNKVCVHEVSKTAMELGISDRCCI